MHRKHRKKVLLSIVNILLRANKYGMKGNKNYIYKTKRKPEKNRQNVTDSGACDKMFMLKKMQKRKKSINRLVYNLVALMHEPSLFRLSLNYRSCVFTPICILISFARISLSYHITWLKPTIAFVLFLPCLLFKLRECHCLLLTRKKKLHPW